MNDDIRHLLTRADAYLTATHTARHDVIAEGGRCAGCQLRDDIRAAASAVPVAAPPTEQALAATTCSAQYHGDEDGARLCIRAAQHAGKAHTDEHGFHWSDTVAVYPLADGTFRTGINLQAALRRLADEAQQQAGETPADTEAPCCSDPTCACVQVNAAGHCECSKWDTAAGARQDGAQPSEPPIVAYRSDGGRLLNCLRHVPPPAARHADFHPVTAEDLPDGGTCTYPECGVDVLIPQDGTR